MLAVDGSKCCNACFKIKDVGEFAPSPRSSDGLQTNCRLCESERLQVRKHGLTAAQKASVAAQQGGCATCGRTDPGPNKGWVVDHDHACCSGDTSCPACRRGVLCGWCNSALGYAFDSPALLRRMADYLESGSRLSQLSQLTDNRTGSV